jgi:hypothetical protein
VKFKVLNQIETLKDDGIAETKLLKFENIPPLLKKLACEIRSPLLFQ